MSSSVSPEAFEALSTEDTHSRPPDPGPRKRGRRGKKDQDTFSGRSPLQIAWGRLRRDKIAMVCAAVAFFFVLVAVFAGVIANFFNVSLDVVLPSQYIDVLTGLPKEGPPNNGYDPDHPMGIAPRTANDNLAHWVYGARTSLSIAAISTVVATFIGVIMGLVGGFAGGVVDKLVSFVIDLFLSLPFLLVALSVSPILNERFADYPEKYATVKYWAIVLIFIIFGWMPLARLIRGEVLSLREREFVQAARVMGMPTHRILFREFLPNLVAPIVVTASLMLPFVIASEAGLTYLGIGVEGASWGKTILAGTDYFQSYPLFLWQPLIGIVLVVVSLNLLGDAIRDALDPKTRR